MAKGLAGAIRELVSEKDISEEMIQKIVEESLLVAYRKNYQKRGNNRNKEDKEKVLDNAVVRFSEDGDEASLFARKKIVNLAYDEATEIEIEDAVKLVGANCEIGDELEIEVDPKTFSRQAISVASQKALQLINDFQKNKNFHYFNENKGQLIIGFFQREKNGNIFVDLGDDKVEGFLPKKYQSPRETIDRQGERIRALITEVRRQDDYLQIVLSRTHSEFVQRLFELEVPEIKEDIVMIQNIVRDPGYRTKMSVWSKKTDVDPVGACVGLKGVRIENVVKELSGEKIDVLHYDPDPKEYIRNALSPAEVKWVILDESNRSALAIVENDQLPLAIGKLGQNVKLASRLVDWRIDVKTTEEYAEMDVNEENKRAVDALFVDGQAYDEIVNIAELPGIPVHVVMALKEAGVVQIEDLIEAQQNGSLSQIEGLSDEDIALVTQIIEENVDIVDGDGEGDYEEAAQPEAAAAEVETTEPETEETEEIEYYECPECGAKITLDMDTCPNCGVGLSFEEEEEEV